MAAIKQWLHQYKATYDALPLRSKILSWAPAAFSVVGFIIILGK